MDEFPETEKERDFVSSNNCLVIWLRNNRRKIGREIEFHQPEIER